MVTSVLARSFFDGAADVSVRGHDRYLIYRMLGRRVSFRNPRRRGRAMVSGAVEDVARNIFSNEVELTVGGRMFAFKEPAAIVKKGDRVVFMYGGVGKSQVSDEATFKEIRASTWSGETAQETWRRTDRTLTKETEFLVGEEVRTGRSRRSRAR